MAKLISYWSLERALSQLRPPKFGGILITAIISAVFILTTASVTVVALPESVQMATFVDNMAYNVTREFTVQQHTDQKILAGLQAIEAAVEYLGKRQDTIAYRQVLSYN